MGDRWYAPGHPGAPRVGDVVVAVGAWGVFGHVTYRQWVGSVTGVGPYAILVSASDDLDGWYADRVRRPTPEELAAYGLSGPTLPQACQEPT